MNHDADSSDIGDVPSDRATIQLWRAPNRMWPVFPTLVLIQAASRLGGDRAKRQKSAIGEGGVVTVFLDGSKVGTISPRQTQRYPVPAGEHSLSLHFLGDLRRSRKLGVSVAEGDRKQLVCWLNAIGWPTVRPATSKEATYFQQ